MELYHSWTQNQQTKNKTSLRFWLDIGLIQTEDEALIPTLITYYDRCMRGFTQEGFPFTHDTERAVLMLPMIYRVLHQLYRAWTPVFELEPGANLTWAEYHWEFKLQTLAHRIDTNYKYLPQWRLFFPYVDTEANLTAMTAENYAREIMEQNREWAQNPLNLRRHIRSTKLKRILYDPSHPLSFSE